MFKAPFSFRGRIRRTEYGLSLIIVFFATLFSFAILEAAPLVYLIGILVSQWFFLAQQVKRSHDIGNSGFWVLVPLYGFIILFLEGEYGTNQYGENPKGLVTYPSTRVVTSPFANDGYIGGYDGGHNKPNQPIGHQSYSNHNSTSSSSLKTSQSSNDGYKSGDLYK